MKHLQSQDQGFSRNDIDVTLEHTVNTDAASGLTRITSMNQNISAQRRWNFLRYTRSTVVHTYSSQDRVGVVRKEKNESRGQAF